MARETFVSSYRGVSRLEQQEKQLARNADSKKPPSEVPLVPLLLLSHHTHRPDHTHNTPSRRHPFPKVPGGVVLGPTC